MKEAVQALRNGAGVTPVQGQPALADPQVAALATALGNLSADQREALVAALGGK